MVFQNVTLHHEALKLYPYHTGARLLVRRRFTAVSSYDNESSFTASVYPYGKLVVSRVAVEVPLTLLFFS